MFKGLRGKRVIVNGSNGEAWSGRVVSADRTTIRLDDWSYSDPTTQPSAQEGIVRVPASAVAFIIEVA